MLFKNKLSITCAVITVSNKHVLKKAAKKLGVSIHGYKFSSLDNNDITASITMDVPPHRENPLMQTKEFYGEWSRFASEAKESACLAALTYLKDQGLIAVHDTNFADLKKYKAKFEQEKFWASEFYDLVVAKRESSSKKRSANKPPADPETIAVDLIQFVSLYLLKW